MSLLRVNFRGGSSYWKNLGAKNSTSEFGPKFGNQKFASQKKRPQIRWKCITQTHANLVSQACISLLRCFRKGLTISYLILQACISRCISFMGVFQTTVAHLCSFCLVRIKMMLLRWSIHCRCQRNTSPQTEIFISRNVHAIITGRLRFADLLSQNNNLINVNFVLVLKGIFGGSLKITLQNKNNPPGKNYLKRLRRGKVP